MGLARRRLYKPERKPARVKPWTPSPGTKLTEAGLSLYEAELGVAAIAFDSGFVVGRILGFDQHKNVFHVVGKRMIDRKAVEAQISGAKVSAAIISARLMVGLPRLTREMSGR